MFLKLEVNNRVILSPKPVNRSTFPPFQGSPFTPGRDLIFCEICAHVLFNESDNLATTKMGRRRRKTLKKLVLAGLHPSTSEQLKIFHLSLLNCYCYCYCYFIEKNVIIHCVLFHLMIQPRTYFSPCWGPR